MRSALVVGAGVIGLSTALRIQQILPDVRVSIVADKFGQNTTSTGAAGIFRPNTTYTPGIDPKLHKKWARDSFTHFDAIAKSDDGNEAGIFPLSGFMFYNTERKDEEAVYREIGYQCHPVSQKELDRMGNEWKYGEFTTTLLIECKDYLPWMSKKFIQQGGSITYGHISGFEELVGKHDVIVNCTGLKSMNLLNDKKMRPIRGQMIRVKAPWIKHFTFTGDKCWVIPGADNVIVGGTRQYDEDDTEIREEDVKEVFERACKAVPSLRNAVWDHIWVGIRPQRTPIRVEKEIMKFGNKELKVVHNYGHGGNGVTLSWGTAVHAADYVAEILASSSSKL